VSAANGPNFNLPLVQLVFPSLSVSWLANPEIEFGIQIAQVLAGVLKIDHIEWRRKMQIRLIPILSAP
jgi:hypothetical protein